jgi:ABC-type transport system involved in cytochrome c biogenesis permease subunit
MGWWTGRPAVVLGIAGFGVVMFTYLGVGLLMKSSHAF